MFQKQKPGSIPTGVSERIQALDIIRGVALLGILLMNITGFGLPMAYEDPTVYGGADGWNLLAFQGTSLFFEGTMRGLFTMLFGAGFILLTRRLENKNLGIRVADIYYRRVLWLLLFGVLHSYFLLWPGDILYHYGLFGLFLFPLRNTRSKYLCIAGLVFVGVSMMIYYDNYTDKKQVRKDGLEAMSKRNQGFVLEASEESSLTTWEAMRDAPDKARVEEEVQAMQQGYWKVFKHLAPYSRFWESSATYKFIIWDILSFLLFGMAFFKWGVLTGSLKSSKYLLMMVVGYGVGLTVNGLELSLMMRNNFDAIDMARADITYEVGRLFVTIGHIGLIMLFVKGYLFKKLKGALAAVGRMALTNYIMHTVVCIFLFNGFGFGLFGKLERYQLYYIVFGIWLVQLIVSPLWLKNFRYGPLEWVWRSLSYKKLQPFRR